VLVFNIGVVILEESPANGVYLYGGYKMKKKLPVLLAISIVAFTALSLVNCSGTVTLTLGDFIGKPYGYVYDSDGTTPLSAASVVVKNSAGTALQTTAATTTSTGKFTLDSKAANTGGTFTIEVTLTGYTFPVTTVNVPDGEYLWNMGSISAKPKSVNADVAITVLDSRSSTHPGVGTVALTLTLASDSTKTYTGTTATDGTVTISGVPNGSYKLTGSKDGYFIAPMNVEVAGATATVSKVQAFALDYKDEYGLSFITVWNGLVNDVDSYLTYPTAIAGVGSWDNTLFTTIPSSGRATKYFSNKSTTVYPVWSTTVKAVYMDVDATSGYGPETMNLIVNPYDYYNGTPSTLDVSRPVTIASSFGFDTSVFTATTYYYQGTAVFYLDAYSTGKNLSDGASGAEAKVYAIQTVRTSTAPATLTANTQVKANLLGVYTIPTGTTIKDASILRVNMFTNNASSPTEYFQVVPDMRVFSGTSAFRGLEDAGNGVISVQGRTR
jgi:hypothetical protein